MAGPPLKLEWFEAVGDWLESNPPGRPESFPAVHTFVAAVVQATTTKTGEARLSTRWVERRYSLNKSRARAIRRWLVDQGWLEETQRAIEGTPVYRILIPPAGGDARVPAQGGDVSVPGGDRGGDRGGDARVSHSPTPRTPQEDINKESRWVGRCSNCGRDDGHDADCSHRPFAESSLSPGDSVAIDLPSLPSDDAFSIENRDRVKAQLIEGDRRGT